MTLLEAFRELGSCDTGQSYLDDRRSTAAETVLKELHHLAVRYFRDRADREDAVAIVCLRLVRNGPRGVRDGDPTDDDQVRFFLQRALKRHLIDHSRRAKSAPAPLDDVEPASQALRPDYLVETKASEAELRKARRQFYEELVPGIAQHLTHSARLDFLATVDQLRAISDGGCSFQELLQQLFPGADKTAANRLYKRHSRVRDKLFRWVEDQLPTMGLSTVRIQALRIVVLDLAAK